MKRNRAWRVAGISFEHFHMGDLLRMAFEHPRAEIVGICDEQPARMQSAIRNFSLAPERVFTDYRACLEKSKPDLVILCPATCTTVQADPNAKVDVQFGCDTIHI